MLKERLIIKIVLTGGPSAGKTTAKAKIEKFFTAKGYTVVFVPETASEVILSGITYNNCISNLEFQKAIFSLQLAKEAIFLRSARKLLSDKVLMVFDRGLLDGKAYTNAEDFKTILKDFDCNEAQIYSEYDAVFHLVTAAKGALEHYNTENNGARRETPEEAAARDDKLIEAWTGHPHFRIIDNSTDFDTKINRLIKEIAHLLGEPDPYEIERKFLIEYPDIQQLESIPNCQKIDILQTYLHSANDDEIRVRQRGTDGNYVYYHTIKRKISDTKRLETERRITKEEYLKLLMDADITKHQIRKTRYCLTYENQYFEIDIFPFWNDKAILEIELNDENAPITFPKELRIIKEVTSDPNYKNAALASDHLF